MKMRRVFLLMLLFLGVLLTPRANAAPAVSDPNSGAATQSGNHSRIMLVLGSSNPATRAERIALACNLIKKDDAHFDKVILSGGCGAHGTDKSNCEATDMKRLLEAACGQEISGIRIYKEENSGTTAQNYCFSSALTMDGKKLIEKEDTLYVISSHYHALSVAACFKNGEVDAHYYYTCGNSLYDGVAPSPGTVASSTTPCYQDYTGIAQRCLKPDWCREFQPKK